MSKDKEHMDLENIRKKDAFGAPEGYFDDLSARIMQKIDEGAQGKKRSTDWKSWGYGMAAAVSILVAALFIFRKNDPQSVEELLAEVSATDLMAYLDNSAIDAYEIMESTDIQLWVENVSLVDSLDLEPALNDDDLDLLYERYGVSSDETLQDF